jgi:hypothetical protein
LCPGSSAIETLAVFLSRFRSLLRERSLCREAFNFVSRHAGATTALTRSDDRDIRGPPGSATGTLLWRAIEWNECIIAENEHGITGYALQELQLFDLGFVSTIYVATPACRDGIGSKLIKSSRWSRFRSTSKTLAWQNSCGRSAYRGRKPRILQVRHVSK